MAEEMTNRGLSAGLTPSPSRFSVAVLALMLLGLTAPLSAQDVFETIELKTGTRYRGEVIKVEKDRLTLARRIEKGSVKQTIRFHRITPESLYAALNSALFPLDAEDERLIANASFEAELFRTAIRHYEKLRELAGDSEDLHKRIGECRAADAKSLIDSTNASIKAERFSSARKRLFTFMRRYPRSRRGQDDPGAPRSDQEARTAGARPRCCGQTQQGRTRRLEEGRASLGSSLHATRTRPSP